MIDRLDSGPNILALVLRIEATSHFCQKQAEEEEEEG